MDPNHLTFTILHGGRIFGVVLDHRMDLATLQDLWHVQDIQEYPGSGVAYYKLSVKGSWADVTTAVLDFIVTLVRMEAQREATSGTD